MQQPGSNQLDILYSIIYSIYNTLTYVDADTLYSRIYESTKETDPHSALWRYRTRLSLEHLSYSIQTKSYKILNVFLKQVCMYFLIVLVIFMYFCMVSLYRNLP